MACEEDSWGLREYVASNVAVPEELRPQRRMTSRITLSCWTLVACRLP